MSLTAWHIYGSDNSTTERLLFAMQWHATWNFVFRWIGDSSVDITTYLGDGAAHPVASYDIRRGDGGVLESKVFYAVTTTAMPITKILLLLYVKVVDQSRLNHGPDLNKTKNELI